MSYHNQPSRIDTKQCYSCGYDKEKGECTTTECHLNKNKATINRVSRETVQVTIDGKTANFSMEQVQAVLDNEPTREEQ